MIERIGVTDSCLLIDFKRSHKTNLAFPDIMCYRHFTCFEPKFSFEMMNKDALDSEKQRQII